MEDAGVDPGAHQRGGGRRGPRVVGVGDVGEQQFGDRGPQPAPVTGPAGEVGGFDPGFLQQDRGFGGGGLAGAEVPAGVPGVRGLVHKGAPGDRVGLAGVGRVEPGRVERRRPGGRRVERGSVGGEQGAVDLDGGLQGEVAGGVAGGGAGFHHGDQVVPAGQPGQVSGERGGDGQPTGVGRWWRGGGVGVGVQVPGQRCHGWSPRFAGPAGAGRWMCRTRW
jgi:hypothetical protein